MHDDVGKKFECDITFQFVIAREPNNSHPATSQDLDQRVAAKYFLPGSELAQGCTCNIARGVVSHDRRINSVRLRRKVKAARPLHCPQGPILIERKTNERP